MCLVCLFLYVVCFAIFIVTWLFSIIGMGHFGVDQTTNFWTCRRDFMSFTVSDNAMYFDSDFTPPHLHPIAPAECRNLLVIAYCDNVPLGLLVHAFPDITAATQQQGPQARPQPRYLECFKPITKLEFHQSLWIYLTSFVVELESLVAHAKSPALQLHARTFKRYKALFSIGHSSRQRRSLIGTRLPRWKPLRL